MGLNKLVRTRGFRNFMAKLYGWGASVVILGALFKINHYAGADIMLIVGLGTESLIFFFSGFEPPHVEPDWSLVYPQLAGMYHVDETGIRKPSEALDDMLKEAKIDQRLIDRLGSGLHNLSDSTAKLSDISDAAAATNEYVDNVKNASNSANTLTEAYKNTSDVLRRDANASSEYVSSIKNAADNASALSSSYRDTSDNLKSDVNITQEFSSSIKSAIESANLLAGEYTRSAGVLAKSAENLDFSSVDTGTYSEQLQKISNNLAALNSVYELQLRSSNEQIESGGKVKETLNEFLGTVKESAEMMNSYKDQMSVLNERVSALNSIYGGMLSAMNAGR